MLKHVFKGFFISAPLIQAHVSSAVALNCSGSSSHWQYGGRCGLPETSVLAGMERCKCHQTVISGSGAFVLVLSFHPLHAYSSFQESDKKINPLFGFQKVDNMKKLFGKNTENRRVEEERWVKSICTLSAKYFCHLVILETRII